MRDLDTLRALGDQIVPPSYDVLAETAHRRTRRTTTAGIAAAAVVAATAAGTAVLVSTGDEQSQQPVGPPEVVDARPLTHAEGATIHYGDAAVTAPAEVAELDLTDDGVVARTEDGGLWFTDGEELVQLGTLGDPGAAYELSDFPYGATWGFVVSGNTGSRVAWFEFATPGEPELVVFDTEAGEETHRLPLDVEPGRFALLASVTDEFAYWFDTPETVEDDVPLPQQRIRLDTGAQDGVSWQEYAADAAPVGTPRTMMISHSEDGGAPFKVIDGTAWQFSVRGGRVEPQGMQPLTARDGGSNRRIAFDAPAGYSATPILWVTQWLDDDTIVLLDAHADDGEVDLLECRVSTGSCVLSMALPEDVVVPEIGPVR